MKYRNHTCGELSVKNVGEEVLLSGWVNKRRDLGGLIFIDLRDRYGVTQVVSDPNECSSCHSIMEDVRAEYC